jgi:hypothetical protein
MAVKNVIAILFLIFVRLSIQIKRKINNGIEIIKLTAWKKEILKLNAQSCKKQI